MPTHTRMRRSEDFRRTVRRGVRAGRRTVVVHALRRELTDPDASLVGFVVTKAVGNAVHRNRVRRRLRHLTLPYLAGLGDNTQVVVRALPPAATAGTDLERDLGSAWSAALAKLGPR